MHHEQQNEAIRMVKDVTVPVRGIRLHPDKIHVRILCVAGYCPREGYKVASLDRNDNSKKVYTVTVPVRGIRLHRLSRSSKRTREKSLLSP